MSKQQPTVVLVHGAFAESASWTGVIERIAQRGLDAVAVANPLRSLAGDDRNIPAALHRFCAERAGSRGTRELAGVSHAPSVSAPGEVAACVLDAVAGSAMQSRSIPRSRGAM